MRDRIYVGRLISEDELAHSSGLWKKHKYIKKVGDRYYYTKEQLKNAGKKVADSADKAIGVTARKEYKEAKEEAVKTYNSKEDRFDEKALDKATKAGVNYRKTALGKIEGNSAVRKAKRVASAFEVHVDTGAESKAKHEKIKRAAQESNERARKQKQERKQASSQAHERAKKRLEQALKRVRKKKK